MKSVNRGRTPSWWTWAAALALAAPGLWLALGEGVYVGNGTDLYSYQLPMRRMVRAMLLDGQLPQWNPYILGGVPLHAGMQLGIAYPPNWLSVIVSPERTIGWLLAGHLALLCLGGAVLANAHAQRPLLHWRPSNLVTAALLAGSGPTWGHIWPGHLSFVQAWAWAPWIAALALVTCHRLELQAALWACAALAMQLLAGHPQVSYLTGAAVVALLAAHMLGPTTSVNSNKDDINGDGLENPNRRPWLKTFGLLALIVAGGASLAAVQLWPTWNLRPLLNRELAGSQPLGLAFSAPPRSLLTALVPGAFGGPTTRLGAFSYHETVAHFGAAGLALLALACFRLQRRTLVLVAALLAMIMLAPGRHGFLMEALLPAVPGMGSFRVPSRWLLPATLLAAVLAGEAVDRMTRSSQPARRNTRNPTPTPRRIGRQRPAAVALWLLAAGVIAAAASCQADGGWWPGLLHPKRAAGADLSEFVGPIRWSLWAGAAAFAIAGLGAWRVVWRRRVSQLLVAAVVIESLAFGFAHAGGRWRRPAASLDWSKGAAESIRGLVGTGRLATASRLRHANWGGAHDVRVAGGYETAVPAWSNRYANHFAGRRVERYAVNLQVRRPSPWLERMAVSHLLRHRRHGFSGRAFRSWPLQSPITETLVVQRNPRPFPRVGFATKVEVIGDRRAALTRLAHLSRESVLLDRQPGHGTGAGVARILEESNDEVRIETTAEAAGVLVLRDVLLDGWTVEVDDRPAQAMLADALFRAVPVPAGRHIVVWRYDSPGLVAGFALTLIAILLLGAGLWWSYRRRGDRSLGLQAERAP